MAAPRRKSGAEDLPDLQDSVLGRTESSQKVNLLCTNSATLFTAKEQRNVKKSAAFLGITGINLTLCSSKSLAEREGFSAIKTPRVSSFPQPHLPQKEAA